MRKTLGSTMKNTWKNTVFLRLLVTFLLIMVPIYGIGMNIYNWGIKAIRNEIYNSMISQVTYYLNSLETEIQRIKILQYDCIPDADLNALAYSTESMDKYSKFQAMLRLQKRLQTIKGSSRYIEDVSVGIPGIDTTISANDGVLQYYDTNMTKFTGIPNISAYSQLKYSKGSFYLCVANMTANLNKGQFAYLISIKLKDQPFKSDMAQFDKYRDSMTLMSGMDRDFVFTGENYGSQADIMKDLLAEQIKSSKTGTYFAKVSDKRYLVVFSSSGYLGMDIAIHIPENEIMQNMRSYQVWFWSFSLISLVIIVLFSFSIYGFIHKPLGNLVRAFKKVENGDLKIHIDHNHNDEFRYLYSGFNKMVSNLSTLIDQAYKQKILAQNAQLKQLQAQINPHFLYNTFFILYSMASVEDNENVMLFLKQLGSYFKFITRSAEDEVPLCKEVEHARTYTGIQEIRFAKRIKVDFEELPEKYNNFTVPRLIIQPIIENSYKYGLEELERGGLLRIRFEETEASLNVVIEDNGTGMGTIEMENLQNALSDNEYTGETTGIVNIHRRLQLEFGQKSGLKVSDSETGGLKVMIILGFEEGKHVQAFGG